jgi:hypothetical protein
MLHAVEVEVDEVRIKALPLNTIWGDFRVRLGHKMTLMTAK